MFYVFDVVVFDQLFCMVCIQNVFFDKLVFESLLKELYDLVKWGFIVVNIMLVCFVFVILKEVKDKLVLVLFEGNLVKIMVVLVIVIIGFDLDFYEKLLYLFLYIDVKVWFDGLQEGCYEVVICNGSLQGVYLILVVCVLGLDVGLMFGFDLVKVDEVFFVGIFIRLNFLVNLGYGDLVGLFLCLLCLLFDEVVCIV